MDIEAHPDIVTADPIAVAEPLANQHYTPRIQLLRERMRESGLAALALTSPENIYYLTGLDHLGYFAFTLLVLPDHGPPTLVTRAVDRATVRAQVPWCRHLSFGEDEPAETVAAGVLAGPAKGGAIGWDAESMFFPPSIADGLRRLLPLAQWRNGSGLLLEQRAVKSAPEIAQIRHAAHLSDLAMATGIAALRPGALQRQVAADIYRAMIALGGQPPGFAPLIRPTAILDQEHTTWSDGTITPDHGWFLELSASVRRYHAPLGRTVYVADPPPGAPEAAEVSRAGLEAARRALVPGARTGEVYAAWERAVVGHAAQPRPSRHHCGYLVGIGFPPSWVGGGQVPGIRPGGEIEIAAGMTFHLMSWVTRPVGHVVSDTALVTPDGTELLTATPHEPSLVATEGT